MYLLKFVLIIAILINFISCSSSNYSNQYWEKLVNESLEQKNSLISVLDARNLRLSRQIKEDAKDPLLLSFWGKSSNIDSTVKKQIIPQKIVWDLEKEFGLKNENLILHAGIAHTYGYLFSVLVTPYGFKRERWINPTLNNAFSFQHQSLSPNTEQGALLSNLTYFVGMLAFKNESDRNKLSSLKNVSSEVLHFDYFKIKPDILEERVDLNHDLSFILRTTLVKLPYKNKNEANDYLLIYSILYQSREVLITAFPIKAEAYQSIISFVQSKEERPISIRYNAYIEGVMEKKLKGIRNLYLSSANN